MHPAPYSLPHRPAFVVAICLCIAALLAGAAGCGKKTLDPSRYGSKPAATSATETPAWSPPPQSDLQTPERDLAVEEALPQTAEDVQPQAVAPVYQAQEDDVMVPVFQDVYQLASFSSREYAQRFSRRAESAGFSASIEDAVVNGQPYYRVIGSIRGTEDEIRQAVASLGVNPVQRSHDRVEGRLSQPSGVQSYSRETEPEISIHVPTGSEPVDPYGAAEEYDAAPMSAGAPAQLEAEEPMSAYGEPESYEARPVETPPAPQAALIQPGAEEQFSPEDPLLGPSYRAPMRQNGETAAASSAPASISDQTAAVSKRPVSQPQTTAATTPRQNSIIPPSAPPTFMGSPTCQEKGGRLMASAVGRAEEPLRAERIAVDQAKRSLLLCVQAYREEAGLAGSGPRLTELPVNYLEISDPQRRPDGAVFVSVGIAVEDIPKLTADR